MIIILLNNEFNKKLFEKAVSKYFEFVSEDGYLEAYKFDILEELNETLNKDNINPGNIIDIINTLKSKNPSAGSFVHWSDIDNLSNFAEAEPDRVSELLNDLINGEDSVDKRIQNFRTTCKDFDSSSSFGTPLNAYLLAAFDSKKYSIYKDSIYSDFSNLFNIDRSTQVNKKYQHYLELNKVIVDYMLDNDYISERNNMRAQDFMYTISYYDEFKFDLFIEFLAEIAKEIRNYKEDDNKFLDKIKNMDTDYLEELREDYRGKKKIKEIRFEILDRILSGDDLTITEIEEITYDINEKYDTDITRSWETFNILFFLYYSSFRNQVDYILNEIHNMVRKELKDEIPESRFKVDDVIKDFYWNRGFGSDRCWLALYPEDIDSHKKSAQLLISMNGEKIDFGLFIGGDLSGFDPDLNSSKLNNLPDFKTVVDKFKAVYPQYKKINDQKDLEPNHLKSVDLADPFKTIFYDYSIANKALDFIKSVCENLNINDPDDPIYSFTLREHTSIRKAIHFNYTNALILGFYGEINSDETMARIALLKDNAENFCLGGYNEDDLFNHFKEEEVVLCYVSFDELINQESELHQAYFKTLNFIKDYNSSYNSTPYRNSHIEDIANAVFYPDKRDEIFKAGIDDVIIESIKNLEPVIDFNNKLELNNLHFPEAEKSRLINQIRINLKQGKHIILTGPPGTGKSKLAKEICKQYVGEKYFKMVTATSDWSTFDTIGGYRPDKDNQLYFSSGIFLDCFKSEDQRQANNWLIIDEINRADIDKAFGPLFSALTGDSIKLSFKDSQDKSIEIIPEEESGEAIEGHQYIIPEDWRIIATMNTFDKTSLYEMSYAFMRRFAFIPVVIPDKINDDLLKEYLDCWNIEDYSLVNQLSQLWEVINETRPIGPAIVEDIYQFLLEQNGDPDTKKTQPDYTSAIINYVLPQFEGLPQEELNKFFYNKLEELDFINDLDVIQRFANDYFHLGGS